MPIGVHSCLDIGIAVALDTTGIEFLFQLLACNFFALGSGEFIRGFVGLDERVGYPQ